MEILNRTNAPFGNEVWNIIDTQMSEFLSKKLVLRSIVDFNDTYTFDTDAISTKNLKKLSSKDGLTISTREPIKIVEIKKSFNISKNIIEDIKRGIQDFDDKDFTTAADNFSTIENNLILNGISQANITGILSNKSVESIEVSDYKDLLQGVAKSLGIFNKNFVSGSFKLIISNTTLAKLYTEFFDGISLKTKIDDMLGVGNIIISDDIGDKKVLIVAQRGGDFEFFSALDVSIGFEKENKNDIELFLLETCAFRTTGAEGAVIINIK